MLSGSYDKTLKLWDAATGALLRTFQGHSDGQLGCVLARRCPCAALGNKDNTLKLWDAASGALLRTFHGHSAPVNSVAFSPDGRRIVSGSEDTTFRLWDPGTGDLLASVIATRDGEWLAITPEGFFAASPNGAKILSVVRGLEVFSIEQFYQALYRPDLVREKLVGDPNGKVREAASKVDLEKLLDSGVAPKVAITSHKAIDNSPGDLLTLEAQLSDQGGGIGRVEWRINGITVEVLDKPTIVGPDVHAETVGRS